MIQAAQHRGARRARIAQGVLVAFWALFVRSAAALDVGVVVETSGTAEIGRGTGWDPAAMNQPIAVGDSLRTGAPGGANLAFSDRSLSAALAGVESAVLVSALTIQDRSLVSVEKYEFDPRGPAAQFTLTRGRALATVGKTGAGYTIKTPTAIALATGTTFVVSYDDAAESTDVVGVDGRVRITGLDQHVWVGAQEITTVSRGKAPTPPRVLDEERFRQYLDGFQFIGGGRPESLALRGPWSLGTKVPEPERAVLGVVSQPNTFELCPLTSAPTCATQQPFSGLGSVDIQF